MRARVWVSYRGPASWSRHLRPPRATPLCELACGSHFQGRQAASRHLRPPRATPLCELACGSLIAGVKLRLATSGHLELHLCASSCVGLTLPHSGTYSCAASCRVHLSPPRATPLCELACGSLIAGRQAASRHLRPPRATPLCELACGSRSAALSATRPGLHTSQGRCFMGSCWGCADQAHHLSMDACCGPSCWMLMARLSWAWGCQRPLCCAWRC